MLNDDDYLMSITIQFDNTKDPLEIKITVDQEALGFQNCLQLRDTLRKSITPEVGKCILDLHQVNHIDRMGLGTLLIARELLKGNYSDPHPQIRQTVRIMRG